METEFISELSLHKIVFSFLWKALILSSISAKIEFQIVQQEEVEPFRNNCSEKSKHPNRIHIVES